jgi:hypothetical protein
MTRLLFAMIPALALTSGAPQTPARLSPAPAPPGSAMLSGTVVTADTAARPVRRAMVKLTVVNDTTDRVAVVGSQDAMTDDAGAFIFMNLPAGRYVLSASKEGMVFVSYGAKRIDGPGSPISVADGERLAPITLRMPRGAVITGTVRDPNGEPATGVRVNVMRYQFSSQSGERELRSVGLGLGVETDDRGGYRVFGLAPGEYVALVTAAIGPRTGTDVHQTTAADVQWAKNMLGTGSRTGTAAPPAVPNVDYAPVFYPGTAVQADAGTITLGAGEERTGVDIPLLMVPTAKINGVITYADGPLPDSLQVNVIAHNRITGLPFAGFSTAPPVNRDGRFTVTGLTPGVYTLTTRPRATGGQRGGGGATAASIAEFFAIEQITLSGADVNVTLTLRPGVVVSGRLAFESESAKPPADLTRVRVMLTPVVVGNGAALGVPPAIVETSGEFTFRGVAPGQYRITTASVPGSAPSSAWQPKSAMAGTRDALDLPFDVQSSDVSGLVITFTDKPAELSGVLQDPNGKPAPGYWVIVFARDRAFWTPQSRRVLATRPGSDGRFVFQNVPDGEYGIIALTDVAQDEWRDPAFLATLAPSAAPVTIGAGEKKVQDLRIK